MEWEVLFKTAEVRGIMGAFVLAVLSIPLAILREGLRVLPARIVPPGTVTPILAGAGLVGMVWVASVTPFPIDLAITVGVGAGMGARAASQIPGVKRNGGRYGAPLPVPVGPACARADPPPPSLGTRPVGASCGPFPMRLG